ncbi:U-box domain-containing protein 35 [Carica papaya]|uniref:U-box domain-containing protein 35 n=1 Tax=Carica papaya TaxID=3649 RepID=UPI000B8CBF6C|nr:U-box domain-containing protein 35 [Carica papaya]
METSNRGEVVYDAYEAMISSEIEEESASYGVGGATMDVIEEEAFEGMSEFSNGGGGDDVVYVAVGKSESSMDALSWTLNHLIRTSSTIVYLLHIFPETHHIPTPLGKLPKSQVSPQQVQNYLTQERGKRTQLLQKFINACSASKVKVDTILIESDLVAKAILDLIPILNIRKLVLGTTKSTLRKLRSRRGIGIADQVLQGALESCEIKIICEGKEEMISSSSPITPCDDSKPTQDQRLQDQRQDQDNSQPTDSFSSHQTDPAHTRPKMKPNYPAQNPNR